MAAHPLCVYCRQTITAQYPMYLKEGPAIHPACKQQWTDEANGLMHQRGDFERMLPKRFTNRS